MPRIAIIVGSVPFALPAAPVIKDAGIHVE